MKKGFGGLISRLNRLWDYVNRNFQSWKVNRKKKKKPCRLGGGGARATEYPKTVEQWKVQHMHNENVRKSRTPRKQKRNWRNIWSNDWWFPQIVIWYQNRSKKLKEHKGLMTFKKKKRTYKLIIQTAENQTPNQDGRVGQLPTFYNHVNLQLNCRTITENHLKTSWTELNRKVL